MSKIPLNPPFKKGDLMAQCLSEVGMTPGDSCKRLLWLLDLV